jgi:hypothetical protein
MDIKLRNIITLLLTILIVGSCRKETDLISEKITLSITVDKLWVVNNQFNNKASKSCDFPETFAPIDSRTYYLVLESLDNGEIQRIVIDDNAGSFTFTNHGDNYRLFTSTFDGEILPETGDNYYWFSEQVLDLGVNRDIEVLLENPYSAVVVVNKENTIQPTPTLDGQDMFVKSDGWYIFTKVEGEEAIQILKTDGGTVNLNTDYEPTQIYTYMYCQPLSASISKSTIPFTVNNNIQIN